MKITRLALLFMAALGITQPAMAQSGDAANYPSKPIVIVVPYNPGGTVDILSRLVAAKLSSSLGVSVIVENKAGANGNLGTREVVRAKPDGYVIGATSVGLLAINQWLSNPGFDPEKDLAPVALTGTVPNVIVVTPSLPIHSVQELVAYSRTKPGSLSFASMGAGSSGHLCGEMLKQAAGVDMVHVAYAGAAPALTDLIGGHVQVMCDNLSNSAPHIKTGKVRAIGMATLERARSLDTISTLNEQGFAGFQATAWFGFVAPAGTPASILDKLNREISKAVSDPESRQKLEEIGLLIEVGSRQDFQGFISAESRKWREVIRKANIKLD